MDGPPPPPPPHSDNPHDTSGNSKRGGLPDGNYDIFIVPPGSSGGGFIYFPSLQPQRNSFIAGMVCALTGIGAWKIMFPVLKDWFLLVIASGAAGVALLLVVVGGVAWALGRTNFGALGGGARGPGTGTGGRGASASAGGKGYGQDGSAPSGGGFPGGGGFHAGGPPPNPPPHSEPHPNGQYHHANGFSGGAAPSPEPGESAKSAWERAREETRKKEAERKRMDELRKKAEELRQKREAEQRAKAEAKERDELEKKAAREKEQREREIRERRERLAREREERLKKEKEAREQAEKERFLAEAREKEAREKAEREARLKREREERAARIRADREERASRAAASPQPAGSNFKQATARTETDPDETYSFRPYDKPRTTAKSASSPRKGAPSVYTTTSASSFTPSSVAGSDTTSRTTPPPSSRNEPYTTKDPDKIIVKAVYHFNNAFPRAPVSQLVSGIRPLTDGLILRITTEGMFIDDDVRGVPQREWDVKAWTLKQIETGEHRGIHVLRTNIRDVEGKKFVFVYGGDERSKVELGLQRLRKGPQVRQLSVSGMGLNETKAILEATGWA